MDIYCDKYFLFMQVFKLIDLIKFNFLLFKWFFYVLVLLGWDLSY